MYLFTYLKGQKFSEQNCGVLNFPKNNKIIVRIIALASKIGQIKMIREMIKALYHITSYIINNFCDNVHLFVLFDPF